MEIEKIAKIIDENGGKLYLVGGAIRDEIMRKPIYDKDYCVTGITKEKFKKLFPEAKERGKAFQVFDIEGTEFALARKERKIGNGHKNFEIQTDGVTIEEDLARRDITINSIAKEVLTGKIIDPYGRNRRYKKSCNTSNYKCIFRRSIKGISSSKISFKNRIFRRRKYYKTNARIKTRAFYIIKRKGIS